MKRFAALYAELDGSTSTLAKVDAMRRYFLEVAAADAAWAAYFLAGGKPRQAVPSRVLREAARHAAGIPEWLFDEGYHAVGDLAEAIAHMLPGPDGDDTAGLDDWMRGRVLPLRAADAATQIERLQAMWAALDWHGRFVLNKLITGSFRVGVSRLLVIRALSEAFGLDARLLAQRMMGYTDAGGQPSAERFGQLTAQAELDLESPQAGQPYPFFLAQSLQEPPAARLGDAANWQVEWKWDGIRAQLVRRDGAAWLWSRGEELITERFPEIADAAFALPDGTVLDGEVLAWDAAAARPLPFAALQQRIGRKTLNARVLREAPVVLLAYDLLECDGADWRGRTQAERRAQLEALLQGCGQAWSGSPAAIVAAAGAAGTMGATGATDAAGATGATGATAGAPNWPVRVSPLVEAAGWEGYAALREQSRARGVEGFMLKRRDARYGVGRTKAEGIGEWWKWKIDPYTVDAVLIYAQPGSGKRASLYTDYTFAVWSAPAGSSDVPVEPSAGRARALVPFAKAYSGLTDAEIRQVDAIVRRTTVEKFGPVRSVTPTMVFELGFEGIQKSPRHKSGIAVRFPRILRWRQDKPVDEADTLAALQALLAGEGRAAA